MESVKCDKCGIVDSKDRYVSDSFNVYCEDCKTPNSTKVTKIVVDIKKIEKNSSLVNANLYSVNKNKVVYVLYEVDENEIVGVFATFELAKAAREIAFVENGYSERDHIEDLFSISEYQVKSKEEEL